MNRLESCIQHQELTVDSQYDLTCIHVLSISIFDNLISKESGVINIIATNAIKEPFC